MAGERKGKTYEALVKVALDKLVSSGILSGTVFWNETPAAMTIEPDFCVGTHKDAPMLVIPVTHSVSAKNSDMKFWRNIGELAEAKVRLPTVPRVVNVAFDSVIKEDLKTLQGHAFDAQLVVGDKPYGAAIRAWVDANNSTLPRDQNQKAAAVATATVGNSDFSKAFTQFVQDFGPAVAGKNPVVGQLWALERSRPTGTAPTTRSTFLRRGGGKSLLFPAPDTFDATGQIDTSMPGMVVDSLQAAGLVDGSIVPVVSDPELIWLAGSLSPQQRAEIHRARENATLSEWISALSELGLVPAQLAYLRGVWKIATTGQGLFRLLLECAEDPCSLDPVIQPASKTRVWLFHVIVEWVKVCIGGRNGYGLAKIATDIEAAAKLNAHRQKIRVMIGRSPKWRSKSTVERGLRDWYSNPSLTRFSFGDEELARVACVLASRLRDDCDVPAASDAEAVIDGVRQSTLEAKLLCYRGFAPHRDLIEQAINDLPDARWVVEKMDPCFAQRARSCGHSLRAGSGSTTVAVVKSTLINWQSASESGRDHKKKELCGRALALRYSWDGATKAFTVRPGISKLVLLLDGVWRQSDIDTLVRAGWDEVYFADQVSDLVAAIV